MHLKPINRQGKKRRKLVTVPVLSCETFYHPIALQEKTSSYESQVNKKKDKAAA